MIIGSTETSKDGGVDVTHADPSDTDITKREDDLMTVIEHTCLVLNTNPPVVP